MGLFNCHFHDMHVEKKGFSLSFSPFFLHLLLFDALRRMVVFFPTIPHHSLFHLNNSHNIKGTNSKI